MAEWSLREREGGLKGEGDEKDDKVVRGGRHSAEDEQRRHQRRSSGSSGPARALYEMRVLAAAELVGAKGSGMWDEQERANTNA